MRNHSWHRLADYRRPGTTIMWDYFRPQEFIIERIWFHSQGSLYDGNGVLTWDPEMGFHITARMNRKEPIPDRTEIRSISVKKHPGFIRMKLEQGRKAFVTISNVDDLAPILPKHFSRDSNRLTFIQEFAERITPVTWCGQALFETATEIMLPDTVEDQTLIGGEQFSQRFARSGINYTDNTGYELIGQLSDKKFLKLNWCLPKINWSTIQSWEFAEGLRNAISISSGEEIALLSHEYYRDKRLYTEVRKRTESSHLGLVFRPIDQDIIDKKLLALLIDLFARESKESVICKKIFKQIVEASRQQTRAAQELLMATILEAALRTLYDQPFVPNHKKGRGQYSIEQPLKRFREDYLSQDVNMGRRWKKAIDAVLRAQRRLRDRNAHPDWLVTTGGKQTEVQIEQSVNDMILLARFYGYMILALARVPGLEPKFPLPFTEWNPLITISRIRS